ncbi:hypothetical protein AAVH_10235 [Aphelenchoides avenae]|nr:hypothetical protein AAVH_10235 [Aphelenchus avenae]
MSISVVNDPQYPPELYEILFNSKRVLTAGVQQLTTSLTQSLSSPQSLTQRVSGSLATLPPLFAFASAAPTSSPSAPRTRQPPTARTVHGVFGGLFRLQ